MAAADDPSVPFNISGPDRQCDRCSAEASFFLQIGRHSVTRLPLFLERWCGACVPAGWLPGRKAVAA